MSVKKSTAGQPANWGQLGHLDESQTQTLALFIEQANREELEGARYSAETAEQCSLRFLRARGFDLEKTKELIGGLLYA